jgi:hypothetical protein
MTVRTGDALLAAWSAFGGGAGQDHPSGAGIIESNGHLIVASFSCHCHPAPGHPLRDLPAHRGLPARHPQRSTDRALPPGPSRSARPARPVRSAACRVRAALTIDFSSRVGADRLGGGSRAFPRSRAVSISFSPRTSVAGRRRAVVARTAVFRVCGGLCRAVTGVRLAVLVRGRVGTAGAGIVRAKSAPDAAAGLTAPCGARVRVSSTARMLAAAVKAQDSPACSHAAAVAPSGPVAWAQPNDRYAGGAGAAIRSRLDPCERPLMGI